jgi:uncharacterized protein
MEIFMMNYLKKDRWSPYVVGIGIALLSILSFFFFVKMIGTSTVFVKLAAALWYLINPSYVQMSEYYQMYLKNSSWVNWYVTLVFGIFIGSYLAGNFWHASPVIHVPSIWKDRFGPSKIKRYTGAFLGGAIILFGARLAGGCTSGHVISGGMQLAVSGWLFMIGLFGIGVPAALLIYRRK